MISLNKFGINLGKEMNFLCRKSANKKLATKTMNKVQYTSKIITLTVNSKTPNIVVGRSKY